MAARAAAEPANLDRPRDILVRKRPIRTDDVELSRRMPANETVERTDQVGHVTTVEDRADVQNSRIASIDLRDRRRVNPLWNHVHTVGRQLQVREDLAP